MAFDVGKWKAKVLELMSMYDNLSRVLKSDHSEYILLKSHGIEGILKGLLEGDWSDFLDKVEQEEVVERFFEEIRSGFAYSLESGIGFLSRQVIVALPTYIEAIAEEFLENLFTKHPERANRYLSVSKGDKGYVPLSDVVEAENIEQLRIRVARRATSQAIEGAKDKLFKRIEVAAKEKIDISVAEKVLEVLKVRNAIVHDSHEPDLSDEQVRGYCMAVFDLVEEFGRLSTQNGLQVVDPSSIQSS